MTNLKNKFCERPFERIEFYQDGIVSFCCLDFLKDEKKIIGNYNDKENLLEIWNSKTIQEVRQSILDGNFKYCKHNCPHIINNDLPDKNDIKDDYFREIIDKNLVTINKGPKFINICIDSSCNLKCPSCRINHYKSSNFIQIKNEKLLKKIKEQLILENRNTIHISLLGSGELFYSKSCREFLFSLDKKETPNLTLTIQSNGYFLNKTVWNKLEKIRNNICDFFISLDAACDNTYKKLRIGGNWNRVISNILFLDEQRKRFKYNFRIILGFVVQNDNFREIPNFIHLAKSLNIDAVYLSKIVHWTGAYDSFQEKNIFDPGHKNYNDLLEVLNNSLMKDPIVYTNIDIK